jgi:hypothetical protein
MLRFTRFGLAAGLALTLACGADPNEAASNDGSESGSTTAPAESESGSASMTGDGDGDTGDGDGDTTGDGDGDGDSGDGDGDSGDGDGDSGDGDGDTGDGDGDTNGDGDGDTNGDGDGDTGDGDGDGGQDYYGDCPMNNECLNDEYCFVDNFDDYQVCSQNCNNENDCPAVPDHTLKCIGLNGNLFQKRCFISCESEEQCPIGMECQGENLDIDFICVYPQP